MFALFGSGISATEGSLPSLVFHCVRPFNCSPSSPDMEDLNALFHPGLRLEDIDDSQDSALCHFIWRVSDVQTRIPEDLLEIIIRKHLSSQPICRLFELRVLSKHFKAFLTEFKLLGILHVQDCWMLGQTCARRNDNAFVLDTYDVVQKKRQQVAIPTDIALSRDGRSGLNFSYELKVSSSQGGESGLVYLEICGASTSDAPLYQRTTRKCFVLNPMTKSVRQLNLDYSFQQIDRVCSGYLSWASSHGGEEMWPSLLDPITEKWNRIDLNFTARGSIKKDKAVVNEVVYQRYHRRDLKDQLIKYDTRQGTIREETTTGLPDNMMNELLFHHEGQIYLAAVLDFPATARLPALKDVLLYELKSTNWEIVSEITETVLAELTKAHPALHEFKFFYIDHELLVASVVSERRINGSYVSFRGARYRCHAIAAYDLTSHAWRKDDASRLGPELHVDTTVFRPRLDIVA